MEMSINGFLSIPKKERMKLIKKLKVETKERIFKNTLTITQLASLDKVESYKERVRIRHEIIQKEPNILFWDYLEYLDTSGEVIRSSSMLISTNGDLVTLSNKGALYFNLASDWDGTNKYKGIKIGKKQARTHRAVASTFIPIPENLRDVGYKILEVNHKDFKKFNNAWDNIEWTTRIGNVRHSHNYNDYTNYEHYLMEVIVDNGFLGRKFVINRLTEEGPYPLSFIAGSIKIGENPSGFKVVNIPKEEIDRYEQGYPKDIKALFDADKKYFQTYIKPVIGTVLIGRHRGLKFSLFGSDEMNEYFNQGGILKAASGEHIQALGCSYVHCSHKEGIPLRNAMTKKISDEIKSMLPIIGPYKGVVLTGKNEGYEFYILSMGECQPYFNNQQVGAVANGHKKSHRGCAFSKIEYENVPMKYPTMTNEIMVDIKKNI